MFGIICLTPGQTKVCDQTPVNCLRNTRIYLKRASQTEPKSTQRRTCVVYQLLASSHKYALLWGERFQRASTCERTLPYIQTVRHSAPETHSNNTWVTHSFESKNHRITCIPHTTTPIRDECTSMHWPPRVLHIRSVCFLYIVAQ